jgi:hypothetical protein
VVSLGKVNNETNVGKYPPARMMNSRTDEQGTDEVEYKMKNGKDKRKRLNENDSMVMPDRE